MREFQEYVKEYGDLGRAVAAAWADLQREVRESFGPKRAALERVIAQAQAQMRTLLGEEAEDRLMADLLMAVWDRAEQSRNELDRQVRKWAEERIIALVEAALERLGRDIAEVLETASTAVAYVRAVNSRRELTWLMLGRLLGMVAAHNEDVRPLLGQKLEGLADGARFWEALRSLPPEWQGWWFLPSYEEAVEEAQAEE